MWDWISKLADLQRSGTPLTIVTLVSCTGSTPREVGAKMIVLADGTFFGTVGGGRLEELCIKEAIVALLGDQPRTVRYPLGAKAGQCCGGVVDALFEVVSTGPRLYLFGAGHVGRAVCDVLQGTPFRIDVIEEREHWFDENPLPKAVCTHDGPWDATLAALPWSATSTFVAIMTHRHDLDQAIVDAVISKPAKYIGLIGSQTKWQKFRARLLERGRSEADLQRVKCPIGLDIGGKAPREVAISVASELLRVHYGR